MKIVVYEDELIKEYEVKVNREKLKDIRNEIVQNCSLIEYRAIERRDRGYFHDGDVYRENDIYIIPLNVEMKEWLSTGVWDEASYYFDKYYAPDIVHIIDAILVGDEINDDENAYDLQYLFNTSDLDLNKTLGKVDVSIKNVIQLLENYMKNYNREDIEKAKRDLSNIKSINIERPKKSIIEYYRELYTCFEFIFIRTIDIGNLDKLRNEHDGNWESTLDEVKQISENLKKWQNKDFSVKNFGSILESKEFKEKLEQLNSTRGRQKVK